jgi:hypothetical protein
MSVRMFDEVVYRTATLYQVEVNGRPFVALGINTIFFSEEEARTFVRTYHFKDEDEVVVAPMEIYGGEDNGKKKVKIKTKKKVFQQRALRSW